LTDNARYFTSDFIESVFELTKSKHVKTTPYAPQTNGNAEKACGIVKDMLKHYVDQDLKNWDTFLPKVTFCYNTSIHHSTRVSPFMLLYGREATFPLDITYNLINEFTFGNKYKNAMQNIRELVQLRIEDSQIKNKLKYDSMHRDVQFELGDLVSLYTPHTEMGLSKKFLSQRSGPYKVIHKHSPLVYTIQLVANPRKIRKSHIRRLRKWNNQAIDELDQTNVVVKKATTPEEQSISRSRKDYRDVSKDGTEKSSEDRTFPGGKVMR
jgi:hypothetical protein